MATTATETASTEVIRSRDDASREASFTGILAYAAPVAGSYFFYIPMWSILPGIYATYFGLTLTSVAGVVLFIRLFDGVSDLTVGYLSDRHRARGGSRKPWVIAGGLGAIVACHYLFTPPTPTTTTYYLICSLAYFLAFAIAEIPHLTWGSELTLNYQVRARVYGARNVLSKLGISAFYALPLLPFFSSSAYTPEVLRVAVLAGVVVTVVGLAWALFVAPAGIPTLPVREDSPRLILQSIFHNRPLLLYFAAASCGALSYGMWFGLIYIYLDSYLKMGEQAAVMFLVATAASTFTTPLWLRLIRKTSKATTWAVGIAIFGCQLLGTLWIEPGDPWWRALIVVFLANLCFTTNDVAAVSCIGDIIDYGKLKFRADRGATYFAIQNLLFKVALGIGGGLALGIAGKFGFRTEDAIHSASAIWGLQLAFIVLPACFALVCLLLVIRTPIDRRRHRTIQRRLESRLLRSGV